MTVPRHAVSDHRVRRRRRRKAVAAGQAELERLFAARDSRRAARRFVAVSYMPIYRRESDRSPGGENESKLVAGSVEMDKINVLPTCYKKHRSPKGERCL